MKDLLGQSLRFVLVGVANTAIGLLAIYGMTYFVGGRPVLANAVGYAIGFCVSYVLNRRWTFSDKRPAQKSLPAYLGLAAVAYLANLALVVASARYLGLGPYLVQLPGICAYTAVMFLGSRHFVFVNQAPVGAEPSQPADSFPPQGGPTR